MAVARKVVPSRYALRDIDRALGHYIDEAGADVALRFIAAFERACTSIGRQPGIGSPRYADALALPGLRSWPMRGFPYLLFYVEQDDAVHVARVLHGASDIPAWLAAPEGP